MIPRLTPAGFAVRLAFAFGLAIASALSAPVAMAQDDMRHEAVRFAPGKSGALITDRITGRASAAYTLGAEAGQRMTISLSSNNGATYFTVFGPGQAPGGEGLAGSDVMGPMVPELNRFDATLPTSGEYTVLVYLYRSAARRGEAADYTLDISITGALGDVVQGDFADGLQGGPDFLEVRTTSSAGKINIRSAPSTGASVVGAVYAGTVLRNLGCRMSEGRRWCNVATQADPGIEGWAAGDFLAEASGGVATQLPDAIPVPSGNDALVPGIGFNATGQIDCVANMDAAATRCDFGVEREGNGNGWITVTMPDGGILRIRFEDLTPVYFDETDVWAGRQMTVGQESDNHVVMIGDTRLVIPMAVMAGG